MQTIRNRIDAYGVTEPVIQAAGGDRIVVQLPGVDDFDRVRKLIKNTAFLEFRITVYPKDGAQPVSREEILQHFGGRVPGDVEIVPAQRSDKDDRHPRAALLRGREAAHGDRPRPAATPGRPRPV